MASFLKKMYPLYLLLQPRLPKKLIIIIIIFFYLKGSWFLIPCLKFTAHEQHVPNLARY